MGNRLSTCDIMKKEIINVCDGTNLGCATDFEVDICDSRITALIITRPCGFLWLSNENDIVIPWNKIECIGDDTILVRLPKEMYDFSEKKKKKKRFLS